jgi:hypothetical protein
LAIGRFRAQEFNSFFGFGKGGGMLEKKIRRQVLVPLTLTFLLLITAFLFTSYRIRIEDYASDLSRRSQRVQKVLDSLIADRIQSMTTALEFICDQERLQAAMQTKNRTVLLEHGSALLERLFNGQQITHFYFYDSAGNMVLRVYQPENTTKSSARFTKQEAMTRGAPVSGLELGKVGTFTLRIVYPWRINNELVGYIELGQEIDASSGTEDCYRRPPY